MYNVFKHNYDFTVGCFQK